MGQGNKPELSLKGGGYQEASSAFDRVSDMGVC
jgi:hypothetical protein